MHAVSLQREVGLSARKRIGVRKALRYGSSAGTDMRNREWNSLKLVTPYSRFKKFCTTIATITPKVRRARRSAIQSVSFHLVMVGSALPHRVGIPPARIHPM
jgi:hypothetical protein